MESMTSLLNGFAVALNGWNIIYCVIGVTVGMLVGILPGLGPVTAIALLLPITFKLNATSAIIMLAGIYYGSMYGGTVTSVLINVPGEAASVVTCFDGYAMAKQGRAGRRPGRRRHRLLHRRHDRRHRTHPHRASPRQARPELRPAGILRHHGLGARLAHGPHRKIGRPRNAFGLHRPQPRPDRHGSDDGTPALHLQPAESHGGPGFHHPRHGSSSAFPRCCSATRRAESRNR